MIDVLFFDKEDTSKRLDFSVIVTYYQGQWIFVKHKDRDTYEIPGGHIEEGESALEAAKRELHEETGAIDFSIEMVAVYGVRNDDFLDYGGLFLAECFSFGELQYEIEKIDFFDGLPENLTYPLIQPYLFKKVLEMIHNENRPIAIT